MSAGVRRMGVESRVTLAKLEPQPTLPAPAHVRAPLPGHGTRWISRAIGRTERTASAGLSPTATAMIDAAQSGRLSMVRCPLHNDRGHPPLDLVTDSLTGGRALDDRGNRQWDQREFTAGSVDFAWLQRRTDPIAHQPNRHPKHPRKSPGQCHLYLAGG